MAEERKSYESDEEYSSEESSYHSDKEEYSNETYSSYLPDEDEQTCIYQDGVLLHEISSRDMIVDIIINKNITKLDNLKIPIYQLPHSNIKILVNIFIIRRYKAFRLIESHSPLISGIRRLYNLVPISYTTFLKNGTFEQPIKNEEDFLNRQCPKYEFDVMQMSSFKRTLYVSSEKTDPNSSKSSSSLSSSSSFFDSPWGNKPVAKIVDKSITKDKTITITEYKEIKFFDKYGESDIIEIEKESRFTTQIYNLFTIFGQLEYGIFYNGKDRLKYDTLDTKYLDLIKHNIIVKAEYDYFSIEEVQNQFIENIRYRIIEKPFRTSDTKIIVNVDNAEWGYAPEEMHFVQRELRLNGSEQAFTHEGQKVVTIEIRRKKDENIDIKRERWLVTGLSLLREEVRPMVDEDQ